MTQNKLAGEKPISAEFVELVPIGRYPAAQIKCAGRGGGAQADQYLINRFMCVGFEHYAAPAAQL
ncbi:MAG TPA: hypothetical protein VGP35_03185 [Terriglobales bacterium]|jgi:hypothetical protein|nr:hypothetical protein [Terriglobales bacterium]